MSESKVIVCRYCKKLLAFTIPSKDIILLEFPHNLGSGRHDKRHGTTDSWSYL